MTTPKTFIEKLFEEDKTARLILPKHRDYVYEDTRIFVACQTGNIFIDRVKRKMNGRQCIIMENEDYRALQKMLHQGLLQSHDRATYGECDYYSELSLELSMKEYSQNQVK